MLGEELEALLRAISSFPSGLDYVLMQMQAKADDARLTATAASAGGRERIMVRRMRACQGERAREEHEWAPFYCAVDAGMLLLFPGPDAVEAEILKSQCPNVIYILIGLRH